MLGKLQVYADLNKLVAGLLFWTSWLLIKLNSFYSILSPTYVKTHYSIFAIARIQFQKVQSTRIQLWKVQRIFISHNFHVRKGYDLHHLKPDLATWEGTTTTINTCFFLTIFYLLSKLHTQRCATYLCCKRERVNIATMAPPPSSTISWHNRMRIRDTSAKKKADSWDRCASF